MTKKIIGRPRKGSEVRVVRSFNIDVSNLVYLKRLADKNASNISEALNAILFKMREGE